MVNFDGIGHFGSLSIASTLQLEENAWVVHMYKFSSDKVAIATSNKYIKLNQFCEGINITLGTVHSDFEKIVDMYNPMDDPHCLYVAD